MLGTLYIFWGYGLPYIYVKRILFFFLGQCGLSRVKLRRQAEQIIPPTANSAVVALDGSNVVISIDKGTPI